MVLLGAASATARADDASFKPPPRSIDDITRQLEQYKPDPAAARQALAAADEAAPEGADQATLFQFYWKRGNAAGKVGRVSQQINDLRQAAELGRNRQGDYQRVLQELGSAETTGGNLLKGIKAGEAAAVGVPKNMRGLELALAQMLVTQYAIVGDFDTARTRLRDVEALLITLRNAPSYEFYEASWNAQTERARGEVFKAEGRMVEAEGAYRKGLRWANQYVAQLKSGVTHPTMSPNALSLSERFVEILERSLSQTLIAQGKLVEAEVFIRQALRHSLERVGRDSSDTGIALMQLARVVAEEGRYPEATRLAEEALRSFELAGAAPESIYLANARKALGGALVAQQEYTKAINVFRQMRQAVQSDAELGKRVGSGDLDWVLAMIRTGDLQGAETMSRAMLEKTTRNLGDQSSRVAEIRAFHAMALAALGVRDEARREFVAAMPILIEQARSDEDAGTGGYKRQQRLAIIVESYIRLLSEQAAEHPEMSIEAAAETFRLADIARGSAVQRALTASAARATITDPQLADLARLEQDAQRRINALGELLTQFLSAPPDQQLPQIQARMRQDIEGLKVERGKLKKDIERRFPDYADLVEPRPATLAQTQKLLRNGEVLIAWYFGETGGWVWAVTPHGESSFNPINLNRAQLAKTVAGLRKALDPGVASIDEIPAFDVASAYGLYANLLKPTEPLWTKAKTLLVVPHAELGQLPFALLPTASVAAPGKTALPFEAYRGVPWLARRVAVAQLPSVTALASLRKLPAASPDRLAFIGFGDPFFSADQARRAGLAAAGAAELATRGLPLKLRSAPHTEGVSKAELALLPRLPDTREEISEIAKVLNADPERDIFLQTRATVQTVLATPLNNRRVVMFATHGLVPGELDGLTQPALALTSPEVVESGGDGLLTMDDILTLKLNADWVVLSACNTASGEGAGSEAVSGLGRAFFYAGARALLVSNWPVETVAARNLMTDLFRRQADQAGLGKAEALRQAMLGLIDGPGSVDPKTRRLSFSFAHPLFWAPFVVVGD